MAYALVAGELQAISRAIRKGRRSASPIRRPQPSPRARGSVAGLNGVEAFSRCITHLDAFHSVSPANLPRRGFQGALSVENALNQQAEVSATTDFLTGLPMHDRVCASAQEVPRAAV